MSIPAARRVHAKRTTARSPETVSALERGVAILNCFEPARRVLSASDLARLTDIPRPTARRLAITLASLGLLAHEAEGDRFRLGPRTVSLARTFLADLDVRAVARPLMQALAERFGGSVYLALRDGASMVIVEACRPRDSMLATRLDVGSRTPLASSALGRAHLAALDGAARAATLAQLRREHGRDWPTLAAGLERALDDARQHGYCLSVGEFHPEINSVSVPLVGPEGEVMAFNCGGAAYLFPEARLRGDVAPGLRAMAGDVARAIAGSVPAGVNE